MNKYVYVSKERSISETSDDQLMPAIKDLGNTPKRPMTASISALSLLENSRHLKRNLERGMDPLLKSLEYLKKSKISEFSLADKEISTMLVHLDRISRNTMYGQKRVELSESEKLEVELLPQESQFVQVQTRDQVCPLNILIQKEHGLLEVYMSKKIKQPTKTINDEVFTSNHIIISDKSFFFTTQFVALNFTAIKETKFSVLIKFGKNVIKKEKHEIIAAIPNFQMTEKISLRHELKIVKRPAKNFIRMNLDTKIPGKALSNTQEFERKRLQVLEKHRQLQVEMQEKRRMYIKKHEIRLDAELRGQEILDVIKRKQNFERFWLTFSYLGNSLALLRKSLRETRKKKIEGFIAANAARRIQYKFHQKIKNFSLTEIMMRSLFISSIYYKACTKCIHTQQNRKIISAIRESYVQKRVITSYSTYFKSLVLIQTIFRDYQITNQIRLQELDEIWTDTLAARLEKIHSYKKKTKKWKKKKFDQYNSITPEVKSKVISDYLGRMKQEFLWKTSEYYGSDQHKKKLTLVEKVKMAQTDPGMLAYFCPPLFKYLPSSKEMLSLIDSIIGIEGNDD